MPPKYTKAKRTILKRKAVCSFHKVKRLALRGVIMITERLELVDKLLHDCVEEVRHGLDQVSVLPVIVKENINRRKATNKRPIAVTRQHDFTTKV